MAAAATIAERAAARVARDAAQLDNLPTPERAIEATYAILRSNDEHLRELRKDDQ
jgi:hypothetical protein